MTSESAETAMHRLSIVREQMRAGTEALRQDLPAMSVTGESPDEAVQVRVNADGVLTSLRLTDGIEAMSPAEIANAVLRTYNQAQQAAAERAIELLRPLGNTGYLKERLTWRQDFRPALQPEPDEASAPEPAPSRQADQEDDEAPGILQRGW